MIDTMDWKADIIGLKRRRKSKISAEPKWNVRIISYEMNEKRTDNTPTLASVYKGQHASNRVISEIFSVILNQRTFSTP